MAVNGGIDIGTLDHQPINHMRMFSDFRTRVLSQRILMCGEINVLFPYGLHTSRDSIKKKWSVNKKNFERKI